ncbi:unnamed protein product [Adineta steineri]|uniref:F-box domain-containing protein n=1 Tax=Adineta steineri TaxID=433720 RepID=A0A813SYW7_9BILA|nr:unnamed protein product [Adineta steineri]
MDIHTHIEDFSNEIFFEIFDYLHALDIFTAFASLNKQIKSLLQSIQLHVIILNSHYDHEIEFLSTHLTFHAHQVISLQISDRIRNRSSIINLLFNRHHFINLQSCIFMLDNSSTKLQNIIKQIQNLNRLVSLFILQPHDTNINDIDKYDITQTILMNKSSSLRSVKLNYDYDYLSISTYTSITSNLVSLDLLISGSPDTVSVYSILSILRICHRLRYLHAIIKHEVLSENNNVNVLIQEPIIDENNLPISSQLISFDLSIFAICDIRTISYILRCMPNLIHFKLFHGLRAIVLSFIDDMVNGYTWQHMFQMYVPFLSKFDFFILIENKYTKLNLNIVINSFEYFVKKYPEWQMIIDRWSSHDTSSHEIVMLRTFGYQKYKRNVDITIPMINYESFETQSTNVSRNDHYLYYSDINYLKLHMETIKTQITPSVPLFQHIKYLVLYYYPKFYTSLPIDDPLTIRNLMKLNDNNVLKQYSTHLSHAVHLLNVNKLKFEPSRDVGQWKDIQFILQVCPNVIDLEMSPRDLIYSKFFDNQSLFPIFKQIKILKAVIDDSFIRSANFGSKLVQRFPSLTHIEVQLESFDDCIHVIDILLSHLKNLSYLKIHYVDISSTDHHFSRNYIIDKRRQTFGFNIINEHKIIVRKNGQSIEIRLL